MVGDADHLLRLSRILLDSCMNEKMNMVEFR